MKMRLLLTLAGLAIGFALPSFAQQKDTVDPQIAEQVNALAKKYDEAVNNNDAAAAKAAAGREALTRAPAHVPGPIGTFITFDVPGAVNGTSPASVNPAGAITGTYYDVNFVGHGFLRAMNGTLITFDAPGAGTTGEFPGTYAVGINPEGEIAGMYTDANNSTHGLLRASDGTFTTFDPPGSIAIFNSFSFGKNLYITPDGVITGTYFELISGNPFGGNYRVFVRTRDGTFTTFDAATYPPCCIWSFPSGINPAGAITGSFNDGFTINHGFLRATDGTLTTFDVPGAGTGFNQGTAPLGITPAGEIMGLYVDANRLVHGFLFLPRP